MITPKQPDWRQSMTMHLNGGDKWSQLNYALTRNGEPTGIVRITRTNGSPDYIKTVDVIQTKNGDEYNMLASEAEAGSLMEWLEQHYKEAGA